MLAMLTETESDLRDMIGSARRIVIELTQRADETAQMISELRVRKTTPPTAAE